MILIKTLSSDQQYRSIVCCQAKLNPAREKHRWHLSRRGVHCKRLHYPLSLLVQPTYTFFFNCISNKLDNLMALYKSVCIFRNGKSFVIVE